MKKLALPITKEDIRYDGVRGEVTLSREKFDALVRFAQDLAREAESSRDESSIARYRARRASAEAGLFETIRTTVPEVNEAVQAWVRENSIRQLAERAKIPYATCHRIVTQRLPEGRVGVSELKNLCETLGLDVDGPRAPRPGRSVTAEKAPVKPRSRTR